jgi:predicted DNA-binding antitoxin AbrB/MazE fold protein
MNIDVDATYRNGAFHPATPLNLPENTPVRIHVVPEQGSISQSREEIIARRPKSPRFTAEELNERIAKYAVSIGNLPVDFSREDIYSDHD